MASTGSVIFCPAHLWPGSANLNSLIQANPAGRFQDNLIKKFAQQEARSLAIRTRPQGRKDTPETVCYVIKAVDDDTSEERVVGSVDIKLPACAAGCYPEEVPCVNFSSSLCLILKKIIASNFY